MNSKIFDGAMSLVGALGAADFLFQVMTDWDFQNFLADGNIQILKNQGIKLVLIIFIILVILSFKKRYADLYSMLYAMAVNNKLHTIREMVMIEYNYLKKRSNFYKIERAKFQYRVSPSAGSEQGEVRYDIGYSLHFDLQKPLFRRADSEKCRFRFYAIIEKGKKENVRASVTLDGQETTVEPIFQQATINGFGLDQIRAYYGLYEIIVQLPADVKRNSRLSCSLSYYVRENVGEEMDLYVFTIVPRNYGPFMKEFEIELIEDGARLDEIALQKTDISGELDFESTFSQDGDGTAGERVYRLTNGTLKPDMKAAYFVEFLIGRE